MAGILKVDDLRGNTSAGDITITSEGGSATMQLQQGVCKAWAEVNAAGTSVTDSFNVSSNTDVGTGRQQHNHTNQMSSADYSASGSGGTVSSNNFFMATYATNVSLFSYNGSSYVDMSMCSAVFGDLA